MEKEISKLAISSEGIFHTIEGEGPSAGKPTIFLRLAGCNLHCKGWATPENPHGCDTYASWHQSTLMGFDDILEAIEQKGYSEFLLRGDILKYTGGEPLLQQERLFKFTESLYLFLSQIDCSFNRVIPIEFETNATLVPIDRWKDLQAHFVCSPKLANSGETEHRRWNRDALSWFAGYRWAFFKFVVNEPRDIDEIYEKYINPFKISPSKVWLMPQCATRAQFFDRCEWVAEECKKNQFNFSPRLQILIWQQRLGV